VIDPFVEIDPEVDFDSRRAVYFRQMRYGLFVRIDLLIILIYSLINLLKIRMALLASVMA
jgi:aspartate carbamoyltransferase catalytic subunit